MLCYEKIMIPMYQLLQESTVVINGKTVGIDFMIKLYLLYLMLEKTDKEDLLRLKALLDVMDEIPTVYFGFDGHCVIIRKKRPE